MVIGANGQLGRCIKDAVSEENTVEYLFTTRDMLSITNKDALKAFFSKHTFQYCINTAAYTNVEQAEKEKEAAFAINAEGVKNLAETCAEYNTTLIHISTDYVFDGKKGTPYNEEDTVNPINVYGASKLKGEQHVQEICKKYFIINAFRQQ